MIKFTFELTQVEYNEIIYALENTIMDRADSDSWINRVTDLIVNLKAQRFAAIYNAARSGDMSPPND